MDSSDTLTPPKEIPALSQVREQCRNLIIVECTGLLSNMFNQLETSFLEAADDVSHQAEKISTRSAFMEAQSTIEENAAEIIDHFRQQIDHGFSCFIKNDMHAAESNTDATTSTYGPEIEGDIEVRKIAFEGRNLYFKQLYELRHRMALLGSGKKIEEKGLPGGPTHIISSFYSAITQLDLDRQIQITLYKLFDRYVMHELGSTYDQYNNLLIDAGLFPNLKPISTHLPSDEASTQESTPPATETAAHPHHPDNLELNEETTSTWAGATQDDLTEPTFDSDTPAPSEEVTNNIIEVLNRIQPLTSASIDAHHAMPDGSSTPKEIDEHLAEDLRKSLEDDEQQLFSSISHQYFSTLQISTIKLVRWIFEQMIDSPLLPGASKALICSLHIPYLKAATLDQGLFNQTHHPARELLNLIISCGGQWVDELHLQKGIYPKLSETVDRILFEFDDNSELFEELLIDLKDTAKKLQLKTEAVEQRAQESARGRDRLDSARNRVTGIIQQHSQGQGVAEPIRQFLKGAWSDRLTLMLLRDAEVTHSPEWQDAMDMTVTLSGLGTDGPIHEIPIETRQDLEQRIKQNMSLLGDYQSRDLDNLCHFLTGEAGDIPQSTSDNLAEDEAASTADSALTDKEQAILEKLLKLEPGTWFELLLNGDIKPHRVKLSWRSDTSSNHMFVDQAGAQAALIPAETLARDLCAGKTHILGHYRIPFVDRAIKGISDHLKGAS